MDFSLGFFLIFILIIGADSVTTISMISVNAEASVSIPCFYDSRYRNNVKYLCKGYYWSSCTYEIKTNSPAGLQYSISDDKKDIFNVTIKQLPIENTYYWCAVEINGGADDRQYFYLTVTKGKPRVWVEHQMVTGFIGEKITINCHHTISGGTQWCRLGRRCVTVDGSIEGTFVAINKTDNNVFSVTMSGLRPESSGWYYCVRGDFQTPVNLNVIVKPTAEPTTVTTTTEKSTEGQEIQNSTYRPLSATMTLIIPLSLLILIVLVAILIFFILRIYHSKIEYSTISKKKEGEVTYAEVTFKKNKLTKALPAESDADVTYSSVAPKSNRV